MKSKCLILISIITILLVSCKIVEGEETANQDSPKKNIIEEESIADDAENIIQLFIDDYSGLYTEANTSSVALEGLYQLDFNIVSEDYLIDGNINKSIIFDGTPAANNIYHADRMDNEILKIEGVDGYYYSIYGDRLIVRMNDYDKEKDIVFVIDTNTFEVLFTYIGDEFRASNDSALNYILIGEKTNEELYEITLYNINGNIEYKTINSRFFGNLSPDGYQAVSINYENQSIDIVDIITGQIVKSEEYPRGNISISQWHISNKIIFNIDDKAYVYDIERDVISLIRDNMYFAQLTPDGKYLVYAETVQYAHESVMRICIKSQIDSSIVSVGNFFSFDGIEYSIYPYSLKMLRTNYFQSSGVYGFNAENDYIYFPTASRFLDSNMNYAPANIMDGDIETAWCYSRDSDYQDWIKIVNVCSDGYKYQSSQFSIESLDIVNGYAKSSETYYNNARIKSLTIMFSDGSTKNFELEDGIIDYQTIELGDRIFTDFIVITVDEVYDGEFYDDICCSELIIH